MIDISQFAGEIPKLSYKLLPVNAAEVATNCDIETGRLQASKGVSSVTDVATGTQTIYRMNSGKFLQWTDKVNVVKSLVADSGYRILFSGDSYPKDTNADLALGSSSYPAATRRLGIPAPDTALTIGINGTPEDDAEVLRACSYVYTIVGKWEDGSEVESAPSPPTAVIDQYDGVTFELSGFVNSELAGVYTTHYRMYRLNSGNYGAEYQFVDDFSTGTTTYPDNVDDADLGEVIPSTEWTSPDASLEGIIATSHGLVFGFVGNTIYPSEVFIPYAYPTVYSLVTESDIVGLGYTGSMVVVLTDTVPYVLIGQDPSTMSIQRLGYQQPCVAERSIVNLPGGVVYASADGLFSIGESGAGSLITKDIFTKTQWNDLSPENLLGFYYNDAYYGFFTGTVNGFRFDLTTGIYDSLSLSQPVYGGEYCPEDDLLYLIQTKSSVREIVSWGQGSYQDYTWKSKGFSSPGLLAYTAGFIQGDFDPGDIVFNLYVNGVLSFTTTIDSDDIFRISPKLGHTFQIEVIGKATIDRIVIGPSVTDIIEVING
ncbi:MAG: hypothetical protein DRH26_00095 [Deltaproteobacteria bacterium]|nr:MAG: hypothetical protein DRH26_00095 [Deltaproteobacteria bacterium]